MVKSSLGLLLASVLVSAIPGTSEAQTSYGQISPPASVSAPASISSPSVVEPYPAAAGSDGLVLRSNVEPLPLPGAGGNLGEARRLKYALSFNTSVTYDDNIFIQPKNKTSDLVVVLQPVVTLGWGDALDRAANYLRLDYSPSIFFFTDNSRQNSVEHTVLLAGQYSFPKLTVDLSQNVQILSGSNRDVGDRANRNIYTTDLGLNYPLTGKTSLSLGFVYNINDYKNLISSENISGTLGINYAYDPKLAVGISTTGGYTTVDGISPNQTFEQLSLNATYQISGKVSLDASAGGELIQYEGRDGSRFSPTFRLGAAYTPFDGTTVSVSGHRADQPSSSFAAENYAATGISFNVNQRLLTRFTAGFGLGYENSNYYGTGSGPSSGRQDDYFFLTPTLDAQLTSYASAGVFYTYRRNDSSLGAFSFVDNQIGFHLVLSF